MTMSPPYTLARGKRNGGSVGKPAGPDEPDPIRNAITAATGSDLGAVLRDLRRRDARRRADSPLTFGELATRTGWPHSAIAEYFAGTALPPADRFDALVRLLGASPAEQGVLATARDRMAERQRPAPLPGQRRAGGGSPVPRQLPPDVPVFAGRAAELAHLDGLLTTGRPGRPVAISAITGPAGVGKTALAVHWAHRVGDRFPDGQLYVDLRGSDPTGSPVEPATAVRGFLDALGLPPHRVPTEPGEQAALYRGLLTGRRVLVVLDNARDADQVRPLLPGAPGCLSIITSPDQLTGLAAADGARTLAIDQLTADEARQLLTSRLGPDRIAAEPGAVDDVITTCAGLPLALTIVAARAVTQPDFPIALLADELRDGPAYGGVGMTGAHGRLDALDTGDPATVVRAVSAWSYRALTPQAARLFRLLGLHAGPDISAPAAASLAGLPLAEAQPRLAELAQAHLVDHHAPGRYALHDLLRAYAAEQVHATEPESQRRDATRRLLDHYLRTAHVADLLLNPSRDPMILPPAEPDVTPEQPADDAQAVAWFIAEHAVLIAAVEAATARGFDVHAWQLARTLDNYLDRHGHWHDWAIVKRMAVTAAWRLADPVAQAHAHRNLARAYVQLGRFDDAHAELRDALDLSDQAGDACEQAQTHLFLCLMWERQGRHTEALQHARKAADLFRSEPRWGQAAALNAVGWYHALLGDHRLALIYCRQALAVHQELGDRHAEAATWDSLGYAHHHLGDHAEARACYQRALDAFRELGDRHYEATVLTRLGQTLRGDGDPAAARDAWQRALDILDDLDHPDADHVRAELDDLRQRAEHR
jgi:tetratricopeptide (TPR) repeat protein